MHTYIHTYHHHRGIIPPPIPWGVGTRDTGPYIYIYILYTVHIEYSIHVCVSTYICTYAEGERVAYMTIHGCCAFEENLLGCMTLKCVYIYIYIYIRFHVDRCQTQTRMMTPSRRFARPSKHCIFETTAGLELSCFSSNTSVSIMLRFSDLSLSTTTHAYGVYLTSD